MTCTLHVYDVFDEMEIMVKMNLVSSWFNFCIRGLVFLLFIIYENFIKFREKPWVLSLKSGSYSRVASKNCLKKTIVAWIPYCGSEYRLLVTWRAFHGSEWGFRLVKSKWIQGLGTWSGWLSLGGPVAPEKVSLVLAYWFQFLKCTWGVKSYHGNHMFTLVDYLSWVNVGGGCYRVVS